MSVTEAFGDVAADLAHLAPEKIIALSASPQLSDWVEELINRRKEGSITADDQLDLERLLALDLFISLAKVRARLLLAE